MFRNPNRGRVYRRCACRDTPGKQLGARCPEPTNRRHGRWAFAADLPTIDGQRKPLRRWSLHHGRIDGVYRLSWPSSLLSRA